MSSMYLCVDAGGTKVACAISNRRGEILSRGFGGSGNMAEIGVERSAQQIILATLSAVAQLPSSVDVSNEVGRADNCPLDFAKVWVGLAGCDTPKDSTDMTARLSEFFTSSPVLVTNDGLLLSSPIVRNSSPWGVAVVAGTGSVVMGVKRNKSDGAVSQLVRRGGQGHFVNGDPGSAFNLGMSAAKLAADDADFGLEQEGGLAQKVRDYWKVASTSDLPSVIALLDMDVDPVTSSNRRKLRIAAFAPQVMDSFLATPPCPLAVRVVHHCARSLAIDIAAVANKAGELGHGEPGVATLCVTGGAIAQKPYRGVVLEELATLGVKFGFVDYMTDVAGEGAVTMAASSA